MTQFNSQPIRREYADGTVEIIQDYNVELTALQGVSGGTTKISAPALGTASAYPSAGTISFGYDESTSSITVFVKNALGNSLSGRVVVGTLASATAATNVLGPVK